eukprot:1188958-Prorocentrum_minimum.AAC.3
MEADAGHPIVDGPLYVHGMGMAFNWFADTVVAVCRWMDAEDAPLIQLISTWDTGVYIIVVGVFLYVNLTFFRLVTNAAAPCLNWSFQFFWFSARDSIAPPLSCLGGRFVKRCACRDG